MKEALLCWCVYVYVCVEGGKERVKTARGKLRGFAPTRKARIALSVSFPYPHHTPFNLLPHFLDGAFICREKEERGADTDEKGEVGETREGRDRRNKQTARRGS